MFLHCIYYGLCHFPLIKSGTPLFGNDAQRLCVSWIFEPLDDKATIEKGAGLGLFITKKVLEEHRGTLQLESRLGAGTIATLRVPQAHTALGYYSRPDAAIQS